MLITYLFSKLVKKIQIPAIKNSKVDHTSKICSGSHFVNSTIQKYSYIGNYCTIIYTNIGAYCPIADNCIIGGASHPMNWVSTSPVFFSGKNVLRKNFADHIYSDIRITSIGNDVWIGNNCLIKSGVQISDGAIVGMGSVLTKNIGPYEIWAGNPAKMIRKRFSDENIKKLLDYNWWSLDVREVSEIGSNFNDVDKFINEFHKGKK